MLETLGRRLPELVGDGAREDGHGDGRRDEGDGDRVTVDDETRAREADRTFRERADARPAATPADDAPRHLVCVVVDALRADAVGPEVTPFLDAVTATAAVSPSTWTFPAVTSLLSGRYPHAHGAMRETDGFADSVADVTPLPARVDGTPLLPELLAGAEYETYGAFGFVVPFLALEGAFATHALYEDAPAERLLADHREWLVERRGDRTFSYLHLSDLHEPVEPPDDYLAAHEVDAEIPGIAGWRHEAVVESTPTVDRYRDHRRRLYRATTEYVDNRLAVFHRRLRDLTEGEVALVVTADHGEGFWDRARLHADHFADPRPAHCVGHGGAPFEAITRVPLGATGPGIEVPPDRRSSLVDVTPTLLDAVGIESPNGSDGVPLSEPVADGRRLLVEAVRYGYEKKAVYGDGRKLVRSRGDDVSLALALPDEEPLDPPPDAVAALREELPGWPGEAGTDRSVSADVERRLARLGYR